MRTEKCRFLLLLVLCFIPALVLAQRYTVTDLGPLAPTGINSWAQVVGNYNGHAFMWTRPGGLRDLGTIPGGTFSQAADINDLGTVVGQADGLAAVTITGLAGEPFQVICSVYQPFVWTSKAGIKGLGVLTIDPADLYWEYYYMGCGFGTPRTYASGVNDLGQVVGANESWNTYEYGFLWTLKAGFQNLIGPDDWQARVSATNNLGQLVGARSPMIRWVDADPHAAEWSNNIENDLGTLAGADPSDPAFYLYCSEASAINDRGQIVGWSTTIPGSYLYGGCSFPPIHAVSWTKGASIQDLGTLPGDGSSMAYAINLFGQVIGASGDTLYWDSDAHTYRIEGRPFIWTQRFGMQDLNTLIPVNSGWVLNSAVDMNVWGQIVGSGTRNGLPHGYLLTPRNPFQVQ